MNNYYTAKPHAYSRNRSNYESWHTNKILSYGDMTTSPRRKALGFCLTCTPNTKRAIYILKQSIVKKVTEYHWEDQCPDCDNYLFFTSNYAVHNCLDTYMRSHRASQLVKDIDDNTRISVKPLTPREAAQNKLDEIEIKINNLNHTYVRTSTSKLESFITHAQGILKWIAEVEQTNIVFYREGEYEDFLKSCREQIDYLFRLAYPAIRHTMPVPMYDNTRSRFRERKYLNALVKLIRDAIDHNKYVEKELKRLEGIQRGYKEIITKVES